MISHRWKIAVRFCISIRSVYIHSCDHKYYRLRNRDRKLANVIKSNQYQPPSQRPSLDFGGRGQKMATHRQHSKEDIIQTNMLF